MSLLTRQPNQLQLGLWRLTTIIIPSVWSRLCTQAAGISYETLWVENEWLRAANEVLWQARSEAEELSEAKQRELASASCATGLSLTQIVTLLAIVLIVLYRESCQTRAVQ